MRFLISSFLHLLYHPFARFYNFVSFAVSLGRWTKWIECVRPFITGSFILELGFGPGHLQEFLSREDFILTGIDLSAQMAHISSSRLKRLGIIPNLSQANANQLPFQSDQFDCIISTFPTNYILFNTTISEAKRVLRPGGRWIILPAAWIEPGTLKNSFLRWLFKITGQTPDWHPEWIKPFSKAGFIPASENWIPLEDSKVLVLVFEKNQ